MPSSPRPSGRRRTLRRPILATSAVLVASIALAAWFQSANAADRGGHRGRHHTKPAATTAPVEGVRTVEKLGRGVVAVRSSKTDVLVTWRLLALDAEGIAFNVYRSTGNGKATKLNAQPLTKGTNFTDTTLDPSKANTYLVKPVVNGAEQKASAPYVLKADTAIGPSLRVPLRKGGPVKFVWVGDLDGDGEYDYVLDRQGPQQSVEAYRSDGTFLWSMDLGPNSRDQYRIEGGSSTIDVGNWDGITVYDFDQDGRAEVAARVGDGVVFGDGKKHKESDDVHQSIAILDGLTGTARATAPVPDDYLTDGPLYARFGVGYLDGKTPSLVAFMKNRVGKKGFNLIESAWNFDGTRVKMQWKWLRAGQNAPDGHNTRIIDVDGDGKDEVAEIGFVLNGDGTLRYSLAESGIVHGDRWYIGDIDPQRPGLEGYGVQQDNPSGLREYYYDASTGKLIWKHVEKGTADVGRGLVGDIDPDHPGLEAWSFSGLYNASQNKRTETDKALSPWPAMTLFWDGDLGAELLNDGKIENWTSTALAAKAKAGAKGGTGRQVTTWKLGAHQYGRNPMLVGDILGDWREEVVYTNATNDELVVLTTDQATDERIYTLAQNPAYRNAMTLKGYLQSHLTDYYLGTGMTTPPRANVRYAGQ